MNRYPIRAAKYAVQLIVLFIVLFLLMNAFSTVKIGFDMFLSQRGILIAAVVVVFALLYPFFGFAKKTLTFNAEQKASEVENVMKMCGFSRINSGQSDKMSFKADTQSKRLMMLYEDIITITTVDGVSVIDGHRKEVFRCYFRMGTYIA